MAESTEPQMPERAIPLADMDLVILPETRTAEVNPDSPNVGTS